MERSNSTGSDCISRGQAWAELAQVLSLAQATDALHLNPGNNILRGGKGVQIHKQTKCNNSGAYFAGSNTSEHQFVQHVKNYRGKKKIFSQHK